MIYVSLKKLTVTNNVKKLGEWLILHNNPI